MSLESFKSFVKEKPDLIDYVKRKEMSWQEFYNLYELYGPNHNIWDKYLKVGSASSSSSFSFKDMLGMFKNIDMNEVQKGIGSLQKGIGYLQNMVAERTAKNTPETKKSSYEPRPMHKYFDD